jgi:hypothetical protein
MVNPKLEAVFQGHDARTAELAREIERLEGQATSSDFWRQGATRHRFALSSGRSRRRSRDSELSGRPTRRPRPSRRRGSTPRGS